MAETTQRQSSKTKSKDKDEPKILECLDDDLNKAKELVRAVHELQKSQEEADLKAKKEKAAHAETKQRMKAIETEDAQYRQTIESERQMFLLSKQTIEKEERSHAKTKDNLKSAKDDVASMRLQMEAMKVEMEAQRKAFVVNVNWASRCTELKNKLDQSQQEYDSLLEQHVKAKADADAASRAQEEFNKMRALLDAERAEKAALQQELKAKPEVSPDIAAKLAEWEEFKSKQQTETFKGRTGNQQALSVLQRSQAQGEMGLKTASFAGWLSLTQKEKKKKNDKDKAMKAATKSIASEGRALVGTCFNEWKLDIHQGKMGAAHAEWERLGADRENRFLEMAEEIDKLKLELTTFRQQRDAEVIKKKQGSQKALAVLQRNQAKGDLGAITSAFSGWSTLVATEKKKRAHKDNVMNSTLKRIASEGSALMANVFKEWSLELQQVKRAAELAEERKLREDREAGIEAQRAELAASKAELAEFEAQRDAERSKKNQGRQKALMVLSRNQAKGDMGVKTATFQAWFGICAGEGKKRKHKDTVMKQTMRKIAGEGMALMASVFKEWLLCIHKSRRAAEAGEDDRDRQLKAMAAELEQSRKKAKDIGDELAKIGIFLSSHTPRKTSSSRPRSGVKSGDGGGGMLPQIDNASRPGSGAKKDGSSTARGERVSSAQRKRQKKESEERRYLGEAGPYTYAEFLDLFEQKFGIEYAIKQWQEAMPKDSPAAVDAGDL